MTNEGLSTSAQLIAGVIKDAELEAEIGTAPCSTRWALSAESRANTGLPLARAFLHNSSVLPPFSA